jgi:hypothetical protein
MVLTFVADGDIIALVSTEVPLSLCQDAGRAGPVLGRDLNF